MKAERENLSEPEILKRFPVKDSVLGWYFRTEEISNGAWLVEGSDLWGRKVSLQGSDSDQLLMEAALQAGVLNEQIKNS